jgi:glycosyltransferase involved in cell wall biosynthesis
LQALFASLLAQSFHDFDVIVVDQNADDLIDPVLQQFDHALCLTRLRVAAGNSSQARNIGLRYASGEIVGFPDDDCQYPPNLLARVAARFGCDQELALLAGPAVCKRGALSSGRWRRDSGPIGLANVWTSVIAFNMFIRRNALSQTGGFDEELGVGATFGSAEETDMAIRVMRVGRAVYDFQLRAVHPDKGRLTGRAYSYGRGLGRVMRRQRAHPRTVAIFLLRPLGGVAWWLCRQHPGAAAYYWQTFRGRLSGYLQMLS